jgi:Tfp pilus assembly protein PilO
MKGNLIILIVLLVLLLGNYFYYTTIIVPQPEEIKALQAQIAEKNKQLLAAQILAEKREGVTQLIKSNLIASPNDSLTEKASVPFLRYLTSKMDEFDIRLVSVNPMDVVGTKDQATGTEKDFIEVPYELKFLASYDELGKFLDTLEKSPHLIRVASFTVSNDIDQGSYAEEIAGKPKQHPVSMQINTIAILKASFRSESG